MLSVSVRFVRHGDVVHVGNRENRPDLRELPVFRGDEELQHNSIAEYDEFTVLLYGQRVYLPELFQRLRPAEFVRPVQVLLQVKQVHRVLQVEQTANRPLHVQ